MSFDLLWAVANCGASLGCVLRTDVLAKYLAFGCGREEDAREGTRLDDTPSITSATASLREFATAGFAILRVVRMRVLFGISILALIALLWASLAIARHIHQARLRRHRELHHRAAEPEPASETKDLP